jgi:uncharacterized protein YdaT
MPWNARFYPPAMRHLSEVAREKAIAVANALLADDPLKDEGRAIRIGIAQAKAWAEHHGLPVHDTDAAG